MKGLSWLVIVMMLCSFLTMGAHADLSKSGADPVMDRQLGEEILRAIGYGIVPEGLQGDYEAPISYAEYFRLIHAMLTLHDESLIPVWEGRASAAAEHDGVLPRIDGCIALFYAMQAMQCEQLTASDTQAGNFWEVYADEVFQTINAFDFSNSPFRDHYDEIEWEGGSRSVVTVAAFASLAKRSHISYLACYDYKVSLDQPLTRSDAILSVVRLYETGANPALSYLKALQQELLQGTREPAEAADLRTAILGSETAIEKAKTFVKGKTYTGTAYYVSNSGNDKNNGKKPDRAWASLARVNKADLKKGDIVFFERGGLFRGHLVAYTPGVTYSAYGTGPKPILTPALDGSGAERWTLFHEDEDGEKIWMFADEIPDCGIIVLNGDYSKKPFKVLPDWSGESFVNHADQSPFSVEQGLVQDLDFFSEASSAYPFETSFYMTGRAISTGALYLRCDAGNPGELYDTVELGAAFAFNDYNCDVVGIVSDCVLDNLCLANSGGAGVSFGDQGWVVQNCELSGSVGTILSYDDGRPGIRGEAFCGSNARDVAVRGNWVHDNLVGVNLEEYENTQDIAVDGFEIAGNLFENNDCDINFQNNNYRTNEYGVLRGIVIQDNLFLRAGGGQDTVDMIRSETDEIFGGTEGAHCISIKQPRYTQDCMIVNNAFYYPLHSVFVSQLEEGQIPIIYGNKFYPAQQSQAFAAWKLDGPDGYYSWIGWDEAEDFLRGYLGATNHITLSK